MWMGKCQTVPEREANPPFVLSAELSAVLKPVGPTHHPAPSQHDQPVPQQTDTFTTRTLANSAAETRLHAHTHPCQMWPGCKQRAHMTAGHRGGHDSDLRVHTWATTSTKRACVRVCVCPITVGRDQPTDNAFISESRTSSACLYVKTTICHERLNPIWPQTADSARDAALHYWIYWINKWNVLSVTSATNRDFFYLILLAFILFQEPTTTSGDHTQTPLNFLYQHLLLRNNSTFRCNIENLKSL